MYRLMLNAAFVSFRGHCDRMSLLTYSEIVVELDISMILISLLLITNIKRRKKIYHFLV